MKNIKLEESEVKMKNQKIKKSTPTKVLEVIKKVSKRVKGLNLHETGKTDMFA